MTMRLNNAGYISLFLLAFLLASLAVVVFKRPDILPWIGNCNPGGYKDGHFMAYCEDKLYGDYEHWAYWNELGPVSIDAIDKADVLFLGNSRTQYAFSTQPVSDYFEKTGIGHYVMGFGMGSTYPAPEQLIVKNNLKPKVLVVNADPFFHDRLSLGNKEMYKDDFGTWWEYQVKRWMQVAQRNICDSETQDGFLFRKMCTGTSPTIYRESEHGHWITDYYRPQKSIPVTYTTALMYLLEEGVGHGKKFIKSTGIPPRCLIVTATPQENTPLKYAVDISKRLGVAVVIPTLKGMHTIDKSHLDKKSADLWSAAFMKSAGPIIESCTNAGNTGVK